MFLQWSWCYILNKLLFRVVISSPSYAPIMLMFRVFFPACRWTHWCKATTTHLVHVVSCLACIASILVIHTSKQGQLLQINPRGIKKYQLVASYYPKVLKKNKLLLTCLKLCSFTNYYYYFNYMNGFCLKNSLYFLMAKLQEDASVDWSEVIIVESSRICYCTSHRTQQAMHSSSKYNPKRLLRKWALTRNSSDCPPSVAPY